MKCVVITPLPGIVTTTVDGPSKPSLSFDAATTDFAPGS
jgi:hypothetical protein